MQINKTDFKVILNHMKSLSQLENNELINQTRYGKTDYNDINQLINIYSSKKISKLMDKINNNFLTFDGGTIREKVANAYANAKANAKAKANASKLKQKGQRARAREKGKDTEQYNDTGDNNDNDNNNDDDNNNDNNNDDDNNNYNNDDDNNNYDNNDNDNNNNNDNGQRQELLDCITKLEKYIQNLQKQSK